MKLDNLIHSKERRVKSEECGENAGVRSRRQEAGSLMSVLCALCGLLFIISFFSVVSFAAPERSKTPQRQNPPVNEVAQAPEQQLPTPKDVQLPASPSQPQQPAAGAGEQVTEATTPAGDELVYLNVQDADIKDVIKQISKATGRNFIIDDKIRGKVTIVSERPMTKEEAYQTFLSALEVAGYTIVKGPSGVIKLVPLKDALQQPIPTHVDTTPVTDMFVTRLIPLQNISAVEMSSAIKGLVSKEGNLFAYPATNTLIITDSGTNIDRLMKIIKELDQEGPQQVLEIVPVVNASARDVGQMVNQLFEQEKAAARGGSKKGGELEEIAEVSKIIPDERTNAIIVLASRRAIDKVRSIISKLDRKLTDEQEGKIHVHYLKHAKAKEMAEMLSTLTGGSSVAAKKDGKATGTSIAEFESGMKITADESTNSLVITSTPKDYQVLVDKVISKLDIQRRQVYLESVVMELSVGKDKEYGLGGAFGGGKVGPMNIFGADPYSGLLDSFLKGGGGGVPSGTLGGLLGTGTIPVTIGNETRNIPSMAVFISALSQYSDQNIVSTPNILTLDNQEAKIEIKETTYYQTQTLSGSGLSVPNTSSADAGLILKITPQIGEGDFLRLKIDQTLSGFLATRTSQNVPPNQKARNITTSVVTRDGQTVILGGLMEDQVSNAKSKVPILGDIPILGNLFKKTTQSNKKVNLLIFITPHIIKDTSDFTAILKRKMDQRNQFIEANYGKKQRAAIREVIKTHRSDLLEFKEGITGVTMPGESIYPTSAPPLPPPAAPQSVAKPVAQPASKPAMAQPAQQAAPSAPAGKAPVITVPSQADPGEMYRGVGGTSAMPSQQPLATIQQPTAPSSVKSPVAVPQATEPAVPRVKAPVISVPPPAPGARGEELDLAY